MDFKRWALQLVFVFVILIVLAAGGALTFPGLSSVTGVFVTAPVNLIFLVLSMIMLTLIAFVLGRGVKTIKSTFESTLLALASSLIVGGLLALLTVFNFPYSVHVNLTWLGTSWYDPWIAIFLIGSPIMMAFVV